MVRSPNQALLVCAMSKHKHALSPAPLLPAKRLHGLHPCRASEGTPFDSVLYDELILAIFSVLDARTLCAVQATSRNCARLASDNQVCLYSASQSGRC